MVEKTMDKIVALAKSRGFVYPGSEIYGGLANTWDYGNLGVELKNNVKRAWWKKFIQENPYNVGVDCAILMNPQTWVASGHLGGFSDPLMDCKQCHERFRADKIIEDYAAENGIELESSVDGWTQEQMAAFISSKTIPHVSSSAVFIHHSSDSRHAVLFRLSDFCGISSFPELAQPVRKTHGNRRLRLRHRTVHVYLCRNSRSCL